MWRRIQNAYSSACDFWGVVGRASRGTARMEGIGCVINPVNQQYGIHEYVQINQQWSIDPRNIFSSRNASRRKPKGLVASASFAYRGFCSSPAFPGDAGCRSPSHVCAPLYGSDSLHPNKKLDLLVVTLPGLLVVTTRGTRQGT